MQHFNHLVITYTDPDNRVDDLEVKYRLLDHDVVQRWAQLVEVSKEQYPIDDPGRFYGFGSVEAQEADALQRISRCIGRIKMYDIPVERRLYDVRDQDTLNYLHNIFERHHGLLDQQADGVDPGLRAVLCDLNLLVHRCESVARGARPRHVVTWYGMPKICRYTADDFTRFTDRVEFGTVFLNYAEIGKTIEHLSVDRDDYIGDDAFQPYRHYTSDFVVKFWENTDDEMHETRQRVYDYYHRNQEFFQQRGIEWGDARLSTGSLPVARLDQPLSLEELEPRQWVRSVEFR